MQQLIYTWSDFDLIFAEIPSAKFLLRIRFYSWELAASEDMDFQWKHEHI